MSYYEMLGYYQSCNRNTLINEADVIMTDLLDYFSSYLEDRQATLMAIACALYFADGDGFVNSDEHLTIDYWM